MLLEISIDIGAKIYILYLSLRYQMDQLASEKHTLHFIQIMLHLYNFVTDH